MLALLYCKKIIFHSAKIFFNPLKHKTLIISKQGKYDLVDFQNQGLIYEWNYNNLLYRHIIDTRMAI